ncbi:MAG: potassium transporter Trk [Rhodoferax ferrireducens]|uniref:Trk system potassium uptake protein n=1 Tax=Rhodoferax ferrireducens TaxID=192843 RepID=A0A1W9KQU2_9BURK|nr:MAG: potassium transporter Trk [Rhodoferax ferrireducens]
MDYFAPVLNVLARIMVGYSAMFLIPLAWGLALDPAEMQVVWLDSIALSLTLGLALWLVTQRQRRELQPRDGFLLVNLVWSVLPALSAIPLMLAMPELSWTDAYFEAVSGFTTTGFTILSGLDKLPVSVNVWRCLLQLFGGLGIILLVVAVLPLLGLGSLQLYKAEAAGPIKDDRLTPRIAETARGLWSVYFVFSVACFLAYRWAGMSWADAFMHMCSTMGLGGLSSHDASFAYFNSPLIEGVAIFFMVLAGVSFARYFVVWRTRSLHTLLHDTEVRAYLIVLVGSILVLTLILWHGQTYDTLSHTLRAVAFHVVSFATTTGYSTQDYSQWPVFAPLWMLALGSFATCAGSTGGGMKMVRMILLFKQARRELVLAIHPRVVNPVVLGRTVIGPQVMASVVAFMLIFLATHIWLTMLLLISGMDLVSAMSAVVGSVNNIGLALGSVGPTGSFASLTDFQTWVCTIGMLVGRLELLAVMVLFVPQFWRK